MITSGEPGSDEYFVIQWGTFPYWNIGNMLTILTKYGRPQYFNKKGWDLNRYVQIERCGDNFHFRSGEDGVSWEELAQSPIKMEDLNNKSVKIGLYQLTGTKEKGYGTFDDFIIWKRK